YEPDIVAMPLQRKIAEGPRRMVLANEFDPTGKFVWIHDQTADIVAHSSYAAQTQIMGEFGEKNKSVMGYLDGRAEYNLMVTGALYDPISLGSNRWVVGKYTFIFARRGLPPPG